MREAASFIAGQSRSMPAGLLGTLLEAGRAVLQSWIKRRQLVSLNEFDDHLLRDLGVTREDVHSVLRLPFLEDAGRELQRRALRNRAARWDR